ncbi:MAG: signal peptidase I, partial [bacterium]|nr:signal peptidase I [bacterium]
VLIRSFFYEPFNIPSGSMKPTLEVGDYLFVHKPSYGYSRYSFPFGIIPIEGRMAAKEPKRGDVIVFKLPTNPRVDYIKRVVGLPGETVQVREGRLYINSELVHREPVGLKRVEDGDHGEVAMIEYIETLPGNIMHRIFEESDGEELDNTKVYKVPEGHYFMMGDNRDNSADSRVERTKHYDNRIDSGVGPVPFENIVGRADFIFFSTNGYASIFEIWKWPWSIRYNRFFTSLDPVRPEETDADVASSEGT